MASSKQVMESTKKKCYKKYILKAVFVIAAINGSIKLISQYINKKKAKLPKGHYRYRLTMDGQRISFDDKEVKHIRINAQMSGVDLSLDQIKDLNGLRIEFKAWMSGVCIRVPKNVQVKLAVKELFSGVSNQIPVYLDETLPTIYITGKISLSGLDLRLIEN